MIKKLTPVLCLLAGLGAGVGAGMFMTPKKETMDQAVTDAGATVAEEADEKTADLKKTKAEGGEDGFEYLKLTKQFVVPVVEDDEISALVTMSLSLEANPAIAETFYAMEPKLRDAFLRVLFDHANTGGFDGNFTRSDSLGVLRRALLQVARKDLGDDVSRVLVMSVSRQDT